MKSFKQFLLEGEAQIRRRMRALEKKRERRIRESGKEMGLTPEQIERDIRNFRGEHIDKEKANNAVWGVHRKFATSGQLTSGPEEQKLEDQITAGAQRLAASRKRRIGQQDVLPTSSLAELDPKNKNDKEIIKDITDPKKIADPEWGETMDSAKYLKSKGFNPREFHGTSLNDLLDDDYVDLEEYDDDGYGSFDNDLEHDDEEDDYKYESDPYY